MYLKVIHKYCKAENKSVAYYRLSESYRDEFGFPRQKMIISLGRLNELPDDKNKFPLCERLVQLIKGEPVLFGHCSDETVERLAQHYFQQILSKKKIDRQSRPNEELERVKVENDGDSYLWVKSQAKAEKENSMHRQFCERFEEELRGIRNGILSKVGTKKPEKVWERIGRLKERYPSVHQYYETKVTDNGRGTATGLSFERNENMPYDEKAGIYFLRTSLNWADEVTIWAIYNAIREIEYTFRVLKTDLDLRPIFHKSDDASMAHLGLLAYWIVSAIRYQLKQKGYNRDWREIVRTMNAQKMITTTVENDKGDIIHIRQCSEPTEPVKQVYQKLKYKQIPLPRKKSVWHTGETIKNSVPQKQYVMDG